MMDTLLVIAALPLALANPSYGIPSMFAIDPPRMPQAFAVPFNAAPAHADALGMECAGNATCIASNAFCRNETAQCECLPNFVPDGAGKNCRLAPGFGERCEPDVTECRDPFVCNSTQVCACPEGFLEEYMQCVRDCKKGEVASTDGCYPKQPLGGACSVNEQCVTAYGRCSTGGVCECIRGSHQEAELCVPDIQCPLSGSAKKDAAGEFELCEPTAGEGTCGAGHFCMLTEMTHTKGYCCPTVDVKCPVGDRLKGYNCTNCPWETHHCFSYVLGSFSNSMCCPNACPSSQPIRKEGKCYSRSAFRAVCEIDEQCFSVVGAKCRATADGEQRCACPEGPYFTEFGQCLKRAYLDEKCEQARECHGNTNCVDGTCACLPGWMAERDGKVCIPNPICPMPTARDPAKSPSDDVQYCDNTVTDACGDDAFCHPWWAGVTDESGEQKVYAHCCPKPTSNDFEILCKPYQLQLLHNEESSDEVRCEIFTSAPHNLHVQNDYPPEEKNGTTECPLGAVCVFDPYTVNEGVCCTQVVESSAEAVNLSESEDDDQLMLTFTNQ